MVSSSRLLFDFHKWKSAHPWCKNLLNSQVTKNGRNKEVNAIERRKTKGAKQRKCSQVLTPRQTPEIDGLHTKALHVMCRGSLPSIMEKRTFSLFNDDWLSSIIIMLASSWIKRFFHSRKSEEVLKSWTRNHMSLPLIREKMKRGAITENKQRDLTKSSSTLKHLLCSFLFFSPRYL